MESELIEKKVCNAFFEEIEVSFAAETIIDGLVGGSSDIGSAKELLGGLWVGGSIYLYQHELVFKANLLNKMAHSNVSEIRINLQSIDRIENTYGFITRIIEVYVKGGVYKFRCYKVGAFIELINSQIEKGKNNLA